MELNESEINDERNNKKIKTLQALGSAMHHTLEPRNTRLTKEPIVLHAVGGDVDCDCRGRGVRER